jgi:hypothetical protein
MRQVVFDDWRFLVPGFLLLVAGFWECLLLEACGFELPGSIFFLAYLFLR